MDGDHDITRNYHGGNQESREAKELSKKRAEIDRQRIMALARQRSKHGITCDEAEVLLDLPHQTCSARFSELKRDRILLESDFTRKTRHNANARVMVLAPPDTPPESPEPKTRSVPLCATCGKLAFMGYANESERYCHEHMPWLSDAEIEDFRRALR